VWRTLRACTALARRTLAGGRGDPALRAAVAREVALLHASDWPFMMTRGRSPEYAHGRIDGHAGRLRALCEAIAAGSTDVPPSPGPVAPVPPDVSALLAALDPPAGG
jgi:predicted glycosyl hydrolase (DUF1957 family)